MSQMCLQTQCGGLVKQSSDPLLIYMPTRVLCN